MGTAGLWLSQVRDTVDQSGWLLASLWEIPACRGRRSRAHEFKSHQARSSSFKSSIAGSPSLLYDVLVKGGTVLDRATGTQDVLDVAVSDGKVSAVERRISEGGAKKTIDARGAIVTPGLIDLHTHVAWRVVNLSIDPLRHCLLRGTTTAVDAGSTGELNFDSFAHYVIGPSKTRILAFLNIESLGMVEFADIQPGNTDQEWPSLLTRDKEKYVNMFINAENTEKTIRKNRDSIVGIKWAHHGIKGMARARESVDATKSILMVENKFMPEASKYVKRGDVVTHIFHNAFNKNSGYVDGIYQDGRIPEEFFRMIKRGVVFDVGHGQGSFSWEVAEHAFKEGIRPTTISSDLWCGNINGPVYDLPTVMSKFLHLGMPLEDVIAASTSSPASVLRRAGSLGTLEPGSPADVAVFKVKEGSYSMEDCYGKVRKVTRKLIPQHVLRAGSPVLLKGEPTGL